MMNRIPSSEITERFGLSAGAVRQFIRNHPEMVGDIFVKSGGVWFVDESFAHEQWGNGQIEISPIVYPNMTITFESGIVVTFSGSQMNFASNGASKEDVMLAHRVLGAIVKEFSPQ